MQCTSELEALLEEVAREGFAFAPAAQLRPLLGGLADWEAFAASWNDLPRDTHLPEGHRYRRRRHATLSARAGEGSFRVEPHQPHYQGLEYNALVGGIERWFEPVAPQIVAGATFGAVIALCLRLFGRLRPHTEWRIECHQFRIEARGDYAGQPTPEGVHRDGVDYVMVLLVGRANIASGTTTVHDLDGRLLGSFTLESAFDAALVDDARVKHGVTAVHPIDLARPASRDVLVVTLRAGYIPPV
ncbi:MAG: 2OG-Fe dioxygenase family protein [Pseudomonadota bacterium]|nr:2OG-Fe dioxygenase family protein [Pseudomonadota bacterium]